jgi:hypothetical protein
MDAVSLHERYSLARRNCGFPHGITVLVTYHSPAALPSESFLSDRVHTIQAHFPLLRSRVVDSKTRSPYFALRDRFWLAREVLHAETFEASADVGQEQEQILRNEIRHMEQQDFEAQPMWRVTRFTCPQATRSYLAISTNHEITDGRGILSLADTILGDRSSNELPHETIGNIACLEDTISIKPGFTHILALVWQELLPRFLPIFFLSYFLPPRPWPAERVTSAPTQCS